MILKRQEAIEHIRGQLPEYLEQTGRSTRKKFSCCNPQHTDKNPSCSYDRKRNKAHCFGCNTDYDTLDFIAFDNGTGADFNATLARAAEYFNITIVNDTEYSKGERGGTMQEKPVKQEEYKKPEEYEVQEIKADFTEYITSCRAALSGSQRAIDYLTGRGLSLETIERFSLGYDSKKDQIIIPYNKSNTYYIGRGISQKSFYKPKTEIAGAEPVYNLETLYTDNEKPVFIVEAPFCAISIMQEGGAAVAVGGTGSNKLITLLKGRPTKKTLILCMDNDIKGKEAQEKLIEGLKEIGVNYIEANIAGEYKDPNEALTADRNALRIAIKTLENPEEAAREAYLSTAAANHLQGFIDDIKNSMESPAISTGFNNLDEVLDGGLFPGLYVVGAISSLGKTTFCLQIADQIAAAGQDVLIFSLEMARAELMAKSISRLTIQTVLNEGGNTRNAKTTRGILAGKNYKSYSEEEKQLIEKTMLKYGEFANHIYISEGIGNIGVEQIKNTVKKHISFTGKAPVIIIDYLQILAPYNERATDKQNTDKAVLELKRISRDFKIPVIGISSFNRDNYTAPVNLASFKESGAIEYSSDILIGLQYAGMDYQEGEADKSREKRIRELLKQAAIDGKNGNPQKIQVKILKNRNGSKGEIYLNFTPMFNYFEENGKAEYTATKKPL